MSRRFRVNLLGDGKRTFGVLAYTVVRVLSARASSGGHDASMEFTMVTHDKGRARAHA
jgi:hypothetical protein